jgi:hypothetical protein
VGDLWAISWFLLWPEISLILTEEPGCQRQQIYGTLLKILAAVPFPPYWPRAEALPAKAKQFG